MIAWYRAGDPPALDVVAERLSDALEPLGGEPAGSGIDGEKSQEQAEHDNPIKEFVGGEGRS